MREKRQGTPISNGTDLPNSHTLEPMKDNNTPDRASEFDDIPTYQQPKDASAAESAGPEQAKKGDIYSRMGKVAPQSIPARGSAINDTDEPEIKPLGDPDLPKDVDHSQNKPEFVAPKPQPSPDAAGAASEKTASKPKEKKLFGRKKNNAAAEETEVLKRDANRDRDVNVVKESEPKPYAETQETTAFPRADHSQPLASDAPTTAAGYGSSAASGANNEYKDQDFAPSRDKAETTQFASAQKEPLLDEQPAAQNRTVPAQTAPAAAAAVPAAAATGMFTSSTYSDSVNQPVDEPAESTAVVENAKRGTIDFGLLLIRLLLGAYLIYDAVRVFFGVGGYGLNELKSDFGSYNMPDLLSIAVPAMELAAGVFLVFGLLTPVAAAVATAVTGFLAAHTLYVTDGWTLSAIPDGVVLAVVLAGISLALQFTGPGVISLDTSRSWARRPLASSWLFAIVGIAGAIALWWFCAGVNPLA